MRVLLCLFAFALPISLGIAEAILFLAVILAAIGSFRGRKPFFIKTGMLVPVGLFAAVAVTSILTSTRPELSFGKLHRLIFLLLIFIVPGILYDSRAHGVRNLLLSFVFGASCNVVYDLLRIYRHCAAGGDLYDAGSMTTPQFYMVAICLLLMGGKQLISFLRKNAAISLYAIFMILNLLGLLIHFKRGVWMSSGIVIGLMLLLRRRIWICLLLLACACSLLLLPRIRTRVAQLPEEFSTAQGGRWVLWREVAPALIDEHPWGIGWQAMVHEDLVEHAGYVQPGLDHLHNNLLQAAAELGILGAIVWSGWMLSALAYMASSLRRRHALAENGLIRNLIFGVLAAFVALLLNGMVENNFDDGEIMLLYCTLIGAAVALRRTLSASDAEV